MAKAYRKCILFNIGFIIRRLIRGIRTGEFFWDAYYGLKLFLLPSTGNEKTNYYAPERWPKWNFKRRPPEPAYYQIVKKNQIKQKTI